MAPSIAYFLILGLSGISDKLTFKIKNNNLKFPLIVIILTIITLGSTASFLPLIQQADHDLKVQNEEIISASNWLVNYDHDYKNKIIYSDLWSCFSWYLRTNIKTMPIYKKYDLENHSITPDDISINTILTNNKSDYYLSNQKGLVLTSYKPIKQFGNLIIYKRL